MRKISESEISLLVKNGCTATDWNKVKVAESFNPSCYSNVHFSGDIELGATDKCFAMEGGIDLPSGIYNATLHNVKVADNVRIATVLNYIANYAIGENSHIENVNRMVTNPGATFGVGTKVSVLNETGGREVMIYEQLTAQIAYMMAMYRHNLKLIDNLYRMVDAKVEEAKSDFGTVGSHVSIFNAGLITDVNVGDYAVIEGAAHLTNGSIASSENDPVFVGANVMATDFILASGSKVEDGVVLRNVFVGQGTHLSHLFSAHDSLFFANCACENGEACAIFAGPYTVTMHKSSLLIAGMFSFLNAGSGSNQSNHMYKLGPIHQGVVERGSKTTSDSYILWPAKIGPFSLVMGRHVGHPDTSRLPFSYIIEKKGRTYLVPGVNLKSVGTIRDSKKWPKRDKRKDTNLLDCINFNLLSPFTVSKMIDGSRLLSDVKEIAGVNAEKYAYQNMTIEARALDKGQRYYAMATDKFMGNSVIKRLEGTRFKSTADIIAMLLPTHPAGKGEWVDIAGMLAPKEEISALIRDIIVGDVTTLEQVRERFNRLHADYYDMEWTWVADNFSDWFGKSIEELTPDDILEIVARWKDSVLTLDKMLYEDARKEFSMVSMTGFGLDGTQGRQKSDFEHVRGDFENDSFVTMVTEHMTAKENLGNELIERIEAMNG